MTQKWQEDEIEILKNKYTTTPILELKALLPHRSLNSIRRKGSELKLKKSQSTLSNYFKKHDSLPLLEDTVKTFYYVGFLLADGYVNSVNKGMLSITLAEKDLDWLKEYATFLSTGQPKLRSKGSYRKSINGNFGPAYYVQVSDITVITKFKNKFDFTTKKTFIPPDFKFYKDFSPELLTALLIGYIDGDAWISKNGKNRKAMSIGIEAVESWKEFLIPLVSSISTYFGHDKPIIRYCNKKQKNNSKTNMISFKISNKELLKQLYLFTKNNKLPILNRKWDKLQEINY